MFEKREAASVASPVVPSAVGTLLQLLILWDLSESAVSFEFASAKAS